jgi:hypothetical protein
VALKQVKSGQSSGRKIKPIPLVKIAIPGEHKGAKLVRRLLLRRYFDRLRVCSLEESYHTAKTVLVGQPLKIQKCRSHRNSFYAKQKILEPKSEKVSQSILSVQNPKKKLMCDSTEYK